MNTEMNIEEKVRKFLSFMQPQEEAGLIIAEDVTSLIKAEEILKKSNFKEAKIPLQALNYLSSGSSVYIVLHPPLSKNFYDIIVQYTDRGGMIQLMDKANMDFRSAQFDPKTSHLVLVVLKENLIEVEKKLALRDKVGMVEQI